jgi:hypothetical protein
MVPRFGIDLVLVYGERFLSIGDDEHIIKRDTGVFVRPIACVGGDNTGTIDF